MNRVILFDICGKFSRFDFSRFIFFSNSMSLKMSLFDCLFSYCVQIGLIHVPKPIVLKIFTLLDLFIRKFLTHSAPSEKFSRPEIIPFAPERQSTCFSRFYLKDFKVFVDFLKRDFDMFSIINFLTKIILWRKSLLEFFKVASPPRCRKRFAHPF